MPALNHTGMVEVEFAAAPKLMSGVKSKPPPPPEPHAVPVFEMVPLEEKVAHPGVPPAEEMVKLVVEAKAVEMTVPVACTKSKSCRWEVEEAVKPLVS